MRAATYSFIDVVASLTGPTGTADLGYDAATAEEGITIAPMEDKNGMTVGADGSVMHSLHAGNAGLITVRLLKTAPGNALLMAYYDAQRANSTLWGKNVITVRNKTSNDTVTALFCAFKRVPDLTFAKDGGINEWTFDCGNIGRVLGTY